MISASISIKHKINNSHVTQTVTINTQRKGHLKYFLNNKYVGGRKLEDELRKHYIGDAEHLIYEKETRHKNVLVFTYKIIKTLNNDFPDREFTVFTELPTENLCFSCRYYRETYSRCLYSKKMHMGPKKYCVNYEQKHDR